MASPRHVLSKRVVLEDDDGHLRIVPACVELAGNQIRAVHELTSEAGDHVSATEHQASVDDYGDRLITPAFINAHTHVVLSFLRGVGPENVGRNDMIADLFYRMESQLAPEDIRAFARIGAYESILSGVGLVWDHYYEGRSVAEALREVGLPAVVAPTLQDLAGPGSRSWERALETTKEIAEDSSLADAGIFACVGPHATDTVSESLWRRAIELAAELEGVPLHFHCAQTPFELQLSHQRHGCSPLRWLSKLGVLEDAPSTVMAHCMFVPDADLDLVRDAKHRLVFCPYSQLVFAFPAPIDVWTEHGLEWVVATDCAASNDSMNVQKELRFVAGQATMASTFSPDYRRFRASGDPAIAARLWMDRATRLDAPGAGPRVETLLSKVWSTPGRMHPSVRAGKIAQGHLANLLVWDLDHPSTWPEVNPLRVIALGDTSGAIHTSYLAGKRIGEPGDFHRSITTSEAYRDAVTEASARLEALLARVEGTT